jgi:hypothetical protein
LKIWPKEVHIEHWVKAKEGWSVELKNIATHNLGDSVRPIVIQMDLSGHPPLPLNHHFEHVVLINHDIHPFYGEWNVMTSSFANYIHHLMIS